MKSTIPDENKNLMTKGERSVFNGVDISINCISGILWITWPGSNDVILKETQKLHIRTEGKLCVTSLDESEMRILNLAYINSFKTIPVRLFKSSISFFRRGLNETLFRDSIIPIIR